eukprot:3774889-Rhodomonas_salina.3
MVGTDGSPVCVLWGWLVLTWRMVVPGHNNCGFRVFRLRQLLNRMPGKRLAPERVAAQPSWY